MGKFKRQIFIGGLLGLAVIFFTVRSAQADCCRSQQTLPSIQCHEVPDSLTPCNAQTLNDQGFDRLNIGGDCSAVLGCPQYNPPSGNTGTGNTPAAPASGNTAAGRLKNILQSSPSYSVDKTNEYSLTDYVGLLITVFLGLLGVIFIILMIYGGFTWMIAAGNPEKVSKAGRVLRAAILGLIITIAVYAMWYFLFARIVIG